MLNKLKQCLQRWLLAETRDRICALEILMASSKSLMQAANAHNQYNIIDRLNRLEQNLPKTKTKTKLKPKP